MKRVAANVGRAEVIGKIFNVENRQQSNTFYVAGRAYFPKFDRTSERNYTAVLRCRSTSTVVVRTIYYVFIIMFGTRRPLSLFPRSGIALVSIIIVRMENVSL